MPSESIINRRRVAQIQEVGAIVSNAKLLATPRFQITCHGTQPSRTSGVGHERCGKIVSIEYAFRCYYCGFWFCEACAAVHFGKTRAEHLAEFTGFDGTD